VDVGGFSIYLANEEKISVLYWLCLEEKRHFICVGLWDKILAGTGKPICG
jgi:hypothetical protein